MSVDVVAAVGVDPGASASVALTLHERGNQPLLLGVWSVWGARRRWRERAIAAFDEALVLGQQRLVELGVERPVVTGWIEQPAASGRTRGRKYGPDTWLGLGRSLGYLQATGDFAGIELDRVEGDAWCRDLRLPSAKAPRRRGDPAEGWHRVREASFLVRGASARLSKAATRAEDNKAALERVVCMAESILISTAYGASVMGDIYRRRVATTHTREAYLRQGETT